MCCIITHFCIACETKRHLGTTFQASVCLTARPFAHPPVCLSVSYTFWVVMLFMKSHTMFRRQHMYSLACCHSCYSKIAFYVSPQCLYWVNFPTLGSVLLLGTCLCSECWNQFHRTCRFFPRLFTLNTHRNFLDVALLKYTMRFCFIFSCRCDILFEFQVLHSRAGDDRYIQWGRHLLQHCVKIMDWSTKLLG